MGMSTGNSGGGKTVQSEINVTPLIDVLLVLLIIFLVVMPIMMKKEELMIPRKLDEQIEQVDNNLTQLTIKVQADGKVSFNDGNSENDVSIEAADIARTLRPKLDAMRMGQDKVVFVDFEDGVVWSDVVSTMDTIRGLATDENHDEIKVALKVKEDKEGEAKP